MIVRILLDCLHEMSHGVDNPQFWQQNEILIVPIVNMDSHAFISASYGTPDYE